MRASFRGILAGGMYVLCNYIIANIPCWHLRKALYCLLGMQIGAQSRIMMKTIVTHPWNIIIGNNTIINEYCYLDGRGGLTIGNNVNVSVNSMLITGTHHTRSTDFKYYSEPIKVEDDVWLASRSMVLNGCILERGSIISAGAVVMPRTHCRRNGIYAGSPAKCVRLRRLDEPLRLDAWRIHFR